MISAEQYFAYIGKGLREKYLVQLYNITNPKIIHYTGGQAVGSYFRRFNA